MRIWAGGRRRRVLLDASVQKSGAASMDTLGIPTHSAIQRPACYCTLLFFFVNTSLKMSSIFFENVWIFFENVVAVFQQGCKSGPFFVADFDPTFG